MAEAQYNAGHWSLATSHCPLVLFTDFGGFEDGDKFCGSCGGFDSRSSVGFFALHQAEGANDIEAEVASGFDSTDGGGACGADVIHDDDLGAFFMKAFDAA